MTKENVLGHLRVVKVTHAKWVQKAKILIDKIDIDEPTLPVNARESDFGKCFDSDGKKLSGLSNNPLECMGKYRKFTCHFTCDVVKYFNIYCGESQKKGFFQRY